MENNNKLAIDLFTIAFPTMGNCEIENYSILETEEWYFLACHSVTDISVKGLKRYFKAGIKKNHKLPIYTSSNVIEDNILFTANDTKVETVNFLNHLINTIK